MIYGLYDKAKNLRDMCFDTLLLRKFFSALKFCSENYGGRFSKISWQSFQLNMVYFILEISSFLLWVLGTIEAITLNPNVEASAESPWIFDGMVLFNKMGKIDAETFGEVSEYLLKKIIKQNSAVYFVTDQYVIGQIKSFERVFRATQSSTIRVQLLIGGTSY